MREIAAIMQPSDFLDHRFHDNQHSRIFSAMVSCLHPDQIGVAEGMHKQGTLKLGDVAHMNLCIAETPCSLDYLHYARAVAGYSLRRQLEYHTARGNFDKARSLLHENKGKPRFTGGILP